MENIIDYAIKPFERDYIFTRFINNSDYPLADLIEVQPDGLSAGDEGIVNIVEFYDRDVVNKVVVKRKTYIEAMDEIVSVTHDSPHSTGLQTGTIYGKDQNYGFCWVADINKLTDSITSYSHSRFFKPVFWMELTVESLHAYKDMFAKMGGHLLMRVQDERDDYLSMQQMSVQEAGYSLVESWLKGNEHVYVMSVPASKLQKLDTTAGFGEGIPPMPGISGSVKVKKPSEGDGASAGGGEGSGTTYSSLGSTWWGSDMEGGS